MRRLIVLSVALLCLPLLGADCCGLFEECPDEAGAGGGGTPGGSTGGTPGLDLTNNWAFSTSASSHQVCTWSLDLEMDGSGAISGRGVRGFITVFAGGEGQQTAMYDYPVTGRLSGSSVSLTFDACDAGERTFTGTVTSSTEMGGSNWTAEVVPQRPAAPTDLQARMAGVNLIEWSWRDNSDVETGFDAEWTREWPINPVDVFFGQFEPNRTSFRLETRPGEIVSFHIRAWRNAGKHGRLSSAWTDWLSVQAP